MNSKSTKRALLTSALALVVCLAMLVGSTFAWFTDTATTGVNKIQAGNLDIELSYKNNSTGGEFKKADKNTSVFNDDALWEPGHVEYVVLKIRNAGSLALKYKLGINIAGEAGSTNIYSNAFNLSDYIRFAVLNDDQSSLGRDNLVAAATDSKLIKEGYSKEDHLFAGENNSEKIVTLVVWMPTTVGNEANYKTDAAAPSIDLGVTVVATQDTVENDSFDDQYDKDAPLDFVPISTAAELKTVFANAADGEKVNVSLTGDIDFGTDKTLMIVDEGTGVGDINIQANGHTIKNAATGARVMQIAKSDVARNITITGAKVVSEGATSGINAGENRGVQLFNVENATINLVNCNIEMKANDWSYPVKIIGTKNTIVNITGCTLTGANCIESFGTTCTVNITDCVLNSNYTNPSSYGHGIKDNGTGNVYNIKNTTFNGAKAVMHSNTTDAIFNDLGGNVNNTSH